MGKNTSAGCLAIAGLAISVARNALRILRHRRVLGVVEELFIALQLDEETGSIIVRRKDHASLANQQAAALGNLALQRDDVGGQFNRWLVAQVMSATGFGVRLAAVVPPQRHRIMLYFSVMV